MEPTSLALAVLLIVAVAYLLYSHFQHKVYIASAKLDQDKEELNSRLKNVIGILESNLASKEEVFDGPTETDKIVKTLTQILMSIDEQKEILIGILHSQKAFVKSLRDATGMGEVGDTEEGDTAELIDMAKKFENRYSISRKEAMERARKTIVYRQQGPMGDSI